MRSKYKIVTEAYHPSYPPFVYALYTRRWWGGWTIVNTFISLEDAKKRIEYLKYLAEVHRAKVYEE